MGCGTFSVRWRDGPAYPSFRDSHAWRAARRVSFLNDPGPLVGQITYWTLGRYPAWATELTDEAQKSAYFVPMMEAILTSRESQTSHSRFTSNDTTLLGCQ